MSENKNDCPCTWPDCPRHGDCDACKAYHHGMGQKTSCETTILNGRRVQRSDLRKVIWPDAFIPRKGQKRPKRLKPHVPAVPWVPGLEMAA